MTALRALDLFCGGGAVCAGLEAAGFDVVGVDNDKRNARNYPGLFVAGDALAPPVRVDSFDFIWASPPCQRYSPSSRRREEHPDLIGPVRDMLAATGKSWAIENVPAAPIRPDIVLTGPMVGLHRIVRRRFFELSFLPGVLPTPPPTPRNLFASGRGVTITTSMSAPSHFYHRKRVGLPGRVPVAEAAEVMGIAHKMTGRQIGEAVPPAYAEFVGRRAAAHITGDWTPRPHALVAWGPPRSITGAATVSVRWRPLRVPARDALITTIASWPAPAM